MFYKDRWFYGEVLEMETIELVSSFDSDDDIPLAHLQEKQNVSFSAVQNNPILEQNNNKRNNGAYLPMDDSDAVPAVHCEAGSCIIVYCTTRVDTKHLSHESEFGARRRRRVPQTLEGDKCSIHSSCTVNFFYDTSKNIKNYSF